MDDLLGANTLESETRSAGDLAGVFEYDRETGYFYLYSMCGEAAHRVIDAIQILSGAAEFSERDIRIQWDQGEEMVGLFIRGRLWAAFDAATGAKIGGNYHPDASPNVPKDVAARFRIV